MLSLLLPALLAAQVPADAPPDRYAAAMRLLKARPVPPLVRKRLVHDAVVRLAATALGDVKGKHAYADLNPLAARLAMHLTGDADAAIDANTDRCLADHYGWHMTAPVLDAATRFVATVEGGMFWNNVRFAEPLRDCYYDAVWPILSPHTDAELARLNLHRRVDSKVRVPAVN